MKRRILTLAIAAALGSAMLAACDRTERQPSPPKPVASANANPAAEPSPGVPTAQERKEGSNPVQGQVDPKEQVQRRDFEQKK